MSVQRPTGISVLAWFLIVVHGVSATFNIYGLAVAAPPYPQWLWAALLAVKLGGICAAILLLRMLRLAVWIYVVVIAAGWFVALAYSNQYTPVDWWRYAAGIVVLGIYAIPIVRNWEKLQPTRNASGAASHA